MKIAVSSRYLLQDVHRTSLYVLSSHTVATTSLPCSGRASHPDLWAAQAEGDALQVQVWGSISGKHPRRAQLRQQQDLPQCAGESAHRSPSRLILVHHLHTSSVNITSDFGNDLRIHYECKWTSTSLVETVGHIMAAIVWQENTQSFKARNSIPPLKENMSDSCQLPNIKVSSLHSADSELLW